ncbi:aminotransferase class IV [Desemzia sp. RIT804]|uniref:aminotransferase class IV n=1 Tax=Desemzia sp. RIT 804 TaxID=2810209 RepID=UPI00194E33FB|nr:aminotransferase class IV [Desemzia sp. RIT 804]MBM6614735.1 aminotransferase class IV [Desemzia sp. RIT 804]
MEYVEQSIYYHNDQEQSTENLTPFEQLSAKNVYEVIRVKEGIPLFLEDHLHRFRASALSVGIPLVDSDQELTARLYQLVIKNEVFNQNIKLILNKEVGLLSFFTKSPYPPESYYQTGMKTTLLKLERQDPNIKIQREEYQRTVLAEREKTGAYEVLLVDQNDNVTEGSRSNLFIVKGGKLHTSPANSVLLGIVRSKVVSICQEKELEIIEQNIPVAELNSIEGAFISGTGNDILPIASIDDTVLNSTNNPIIQTIMEEYKRLTENYIANKKNY